MVVSGHSSLAQSPVTLYKPGHICQFTGFHKSTLKNCDSASQTLLGEIATGELDPSCFLLSNSLLPESNRIGNINRWNNKQKHEGCEGSGNRTKGFLDPGNVWILEQELEREREKAKEEDKGSHRLILTIPPSQHSDEIQAWTIIPG